MEPGYIASLKGGLGVRLATDLALPAFLSSVAGASTLTVRLLPNRLHGTSGLQDIFYTTHASNGKHDATANFQTQIRLGVKKHGDSPLVSKKLDEVLSAAHTQAGHARLIAATALTLATF